MADIVHAITFFLFNPFNPSTVQFSQHFFGILSKGIGGREGRLLLSQLHSQTQGVIHRWEPISQKTLNRDGGEKGIRQGWGQG